MNKRKENRTCGVNFNAVRCSHWFWTSFLFLTNYKIKKKNFNREFADKLSEWGLKIEGLGDLVLRVKTLVERERDAYRRRKNAVRSSS